jgi:hypothetical protein
VDLDDRSQNTGQEAIRSDVVDHRFQALEEAALVGNELDRIHGIDRRP